MTRLSNCQMCQLSWHSSAFSLKPHYKAEQASRELSVWLPFQPNWLGYLFKDGLSICTRTQIKSMRIKGLIDLVGILVCKDHVSPQTHVRCSPPMVPRGATVLGKMFYFWAKFRISTSVLWNILRRSRDERQDGCTLCCCLLQRSLAQAPSPASFASLAGFYSNTSCYDTRGQFFQWMLPQLRDQECQIHQV